MCVRRYITGVAAMSIIPEPDYENAFYHFNHAKKMIEQLITDGVVDQANESVSDQYRLICEHIAIVHTKLCEIDPRLAAEIMSEEPEDVLIDPDEAHAMIMQALQPHGHGHAGGGADEDDWSTDEGEGGDTAMDDGNS